MYDNDDFETKFNASTPQALGFSPCKTKLCSTNDEDHSLHLFDVQSGQQVQTLRGHSNRVSAVSFSADGTLVCSASKDKTVRVWSTQKGECVATFRGHSSAVNATAMAPGGTSIASGGEDRTVRVWSMSKLKTTHKNTPFPPPLTFEGHRDQVTAVVYSPVNEHILCSASKDRTLRLWSTSKATCVREFTGHKEPINAVSFSPNGKMLCSGGGKTIKLWDTETGLCIETLQGHTESIYNVSFSPNGKMLCSGSRQEKEIRLWDVTDSIRTTERKTPTRQERGEEKEENVRDDLTKQWLRQLDLAGTSGGSGHKKDSRRNRNGADGHGGPHQMHDCHPLMTHTGSVHAVAYSSDGNFICSAGQSAEVHVWHSVTGKTTTKCSGHRGGTLAVMFSPGGTSIISGGKDCLLKLWDSFNGELLRKYTGHIGPVLSVQFSPNGETICSGSEDESVRVWDTVTGKCLRVLDAHSGAVTCVSFSPNGTTLCSSGMDGRIQLWDVNPLDLFTEEEECSPVMTLFDSPEGVSVFAVAFSPTGATVVAALGDHSVKMWDVETGSYLCSLRGHAGAVTDLSFSVDGAFVASSSADGTVRIWDMGKKTCLSVHDVFAETDSRINAIQFSANSDRLCTGSMVGTVRQWTVVVLNRVC